MGLLALGSKGTNEMQKIRNPSVERAGYRRRLGVNESGTVIVNEGVRESARAGSSWDVNDCRAISANANAHSQPLRQSAPQPTWPPLLAQYCPLSGWF